MCSSDQARVTGGADLVLAASRTHHDVLAARATARPRQLLFLPNGFEPLGDAPMPTPRGEAFRVVFTGTLSLMEDTGTLLEAVADVLRAEPEARTSLEVTLAGPHDDEWPRRAAALGVADVVRWPGPLSHAETRALQHDADVLLLWKPRGEGFRTMVPGKTYEYLDSGRPIVALLPAEDEAAELVTRAGGVLLSPGDRAGLVRTLLEGFRRWRSGARVPDARPAWLDDRRRDRLAATLAQSLDRLPPRRMS